MNSTDNQYGIEEVRSAASPYLPELEACLKETHPEYAPHFRTLLTDPQRDSDQLRPQIFAGVSEDRAVGFLQLLYREWQRGAIAWIDILGVASSHRRLGIGAALVKRAIDATRATGDRIGLRAVGVTTLIDPENTPVVRLHEELGGQIRRDAIYRADSDPSSSGDLIVWYPLLDEFGQVTTRSLMWQVWQFGGLPEQEFVARYGQP